MVEIFEAPDDETAYQCLLEVARHGNVTTETLRAFTREEAEEIVKGDVAATAAPADGVLAHNRRTSVTPRARLSEATVAAGWPGGRPVQP